MDVLIQTFIKYLRFQKRYSEHTVMNYQNDIIGFGGFLKSTFEIEHFVEVEHEHVRSWVVNLMELSNKETSINRKLSSLRSFYKFLIREGKIKISPVAKITALKTPKRLPHFVEENKIDKLFDPELFEDSFEGLRDKTILEIFYATGIRQSELIDLREKSFDFPNNQVKIFGKGKKERVIPFGNDLRSTILNYIKERERNNLGEQDFLFLTSKGKKIYPKLVYQIVKKYLSLITTMNKKSPHVLRHTFATHLSNNGAPLNAIKELLGHSSLAATQVYTHNNIEKLKQAYKQAHPKA